MQNELAFNIRQKTIVVQTKQSGKGQKMAYENNVSLPLP